MKLIYSTLLIFLAACSDSFSEKDSASALEIERVGFGEYIVHINLEDRASSISRKNMFLEETEILSEEPVAAYADAKVKTGETYEYLIGRMEKGVFNAKEKYEVNIPLEINSSNLGEVPTHLYKNLNPKKLIIEKLVINEDFPFSLNAQDGSIEIKELISENGTLVTNSVNYYPNYNLNGPPKDPLYINIKSGEGFINFQLRGQNGGKPPQEKPIGEKGRGAKWKGRSGSIPLSTVWR